MAHWAIAQVSLCRGREFEARQELADVAGQDSGDEQFILAVL